MPTQTESKQKIQKALCPRFKVLLHNDDYHTMDEVVVYIVKAVPGISRREAVRIMLTAHHHGNAVVITCPLEYAELYRDRLQSFGLTATLEPDT